MTYHNLHTIQKVYLNFVEDINKIPYDMEDPANYGRVLRTLFYARLKIYPETISKKFILHLMGGKIKYKNH